MLLLQTLSKLTEEFQKRVKEAGKAFQDEAKTIPVPAQKTIKLPFGQIMTQASPFPSNRKDYQGAYEACVVLLERTNNERAVAHMPPLAIPQVQVNTSNGCSVDITAEQVNSALSEPVEAVVAALAGALLGLGATEKDLTRWGVGSDIVALVAPDAKKVKVTATAETK